MKRQLAFALVAVGLVIVDVGVLVGSDVVVGRRGGLVEWILLACRFCPCCSVRREVVLRVPWGTVRTLEQLVDE